MVGLECYGVLNLVMNKESGVINKYLPHATELRYFSSNKVKMEYLVKNDEVSRMVSVGRTKMNGLNVCWPI